MTSMLAVPALASFSTLIMGVLMWLITWKSHNKDHLAVTQHVMQRSMPTPFRGLLLVPAAVVCSWS